jgi:hypothetical protein
MRLFSFALLFLSFFGNLKAQDKFEEAANFAADYICNCVNIVYADVEPEIRDLIIKIYFLPAEEQTEFVLSLSESVQTKVIQQSMIMADETKAIEMETCNNMMLEEIEKKYKDVDETGFNEQDMIIKMLERLSSKKKCEFAYMLMKIGMEQEQISEDVLIEEEPEEDRQ